MKRECRYVHLEHAINDGCTDPDSIAGQCKYNREEDCNECILISQKRCSEHCGKGE